MKIVQKKLTDLQKIEKNIRRHSPKQLQEYVRSVKMFGQIRPLVVDEKGVILCGNGLYDALVAVGQEKADCYIVTDLTEAQKKKLMLADNRVYELGMTDTDVFEEIIRSLDGDVDVPGWDADLLETLNASVREVNAMVDSYGTYGESDVQRYAGRQEPVHGSTGEAAGPVQASGQVNTASGEETPSGAAEGQTEAFVICPHCGARIPIGGA